MALILLVCAGYGQELKNPRVIPLEGETFHVQGIEVDGNRLWVTAVDQHSRKGYLFEYALPAGKRIRTVELKDGSRYHPGGIAADATGLWVPVAEYRRNSSAVIERRDKTSLELIGKFEVADHIGCVAMRDGTVAGGNWDSRELYVWDEKGKLQSTLTNPTQAAYQDMKFDSGRLVASGLLPGHIPVVDWLEFPSLKLVRRIKPGRTDRGEPYTREGMAFRNGRLYLLPEDSHSRLFVFEVK